MHTIHAKDVNAALDFSSLIDALQEAFAKPAGMPQRQVFPLDQNGMHSDAFAVLPAWNDKTIAVKAFTYFPDNPKKSPQLASLYSKILIFNRLTGEPQALVDGTSVTYWRTAAVSALGAKYLARENAQHLLVFGTGNLATYMALAHSTVRPITTITVWGRDPNKAQNTVNAIKKVRPELEINVCDNIEQCVRSADIISCATGSPTPLFPAEWVKSGTHVDLIGNHNHDRRECDTALITDNEVYVDSKLNVFAEAGELLIPVDEGVYSLDRVKGELSQLCSGTVHGRQTDSQITVFKTVGTALADLVGAQLVFEKHNS
ncbi:ornithine cyclodeaminase [Shewanella colwelliana]|uniref:ornithine cyclodeaminase family protein n=1 Tax=Shewanella colwelliana TaxID=23 RepID=UPI001BBF37C3|nr:ornithine cyclodeaminase family protein [Shewanella colwelliana]GIU18416.1 ornithine cyclodeaminase [Shewanella colwelliana]